jgi:hypothetical protein
MTDPILDISWPISARPLPGGRVEIATVEQDSPEQIQRGLAMVCELRADMLDWDPELGIPDPLGSTDPAEVADLIAAELRAIDPRPERIDVTVTVDGAAGRNLHLKVKP